MYTCTCVTSTHRGVHDARAVGSDGVGNVADVDGVQVLVVGLPLYKDLQERSGREEEEGGGGGRGREGEEGRGRRE